MTAVLVLSGRLTQGGQLSLAESQIQTLLQDGVRHLVIDMSQVEYSDSSGLGLLVYTYGKFDSQGGQLRIAAPNAMVRKMFAMTRTDTLLAIDGDRESSLQHFSA